VATEILCAVADRVAMVRLNRPDKRNALSTPLLEALSATLDHLERDAGVRVVVIRGEGSAFCSGMDLDELLSRREETADPEGKVLEVFRQVERCRHPTIAMVQGDAFAGGCELALHCDLRVAAAEARFAMPLARIGILLPFPLVQKLVEIVGAAATREILLTGRPITAARAREMGMVHRVVPRLELEAAVRELGRGLADNAPLSLRGLKASITRAAGLRGAGDHADLDALVRDVRRSADAAEGIRAVLEKRRPEFTGE
jgi:enoyl-CoA hydratase/carnithine racemase